MIEQSTDIIITGGSSGLGACVAARMRRLGFKIYDWSLENGIDVGSEASVQKAADAYIRVKEGVNDTILLNCAGINKLSPFTDLHPEAIEAHMNVNALGIVRCAKALLPALQHGGVICNVISNASHKPMTHSLPYNASKAAAHMITMQMAHEFWREWGIVVFGVSPNRLWGTRMSTSVDMQVSALRGWDQHQVAVEQAARMPTGAETPVRVVADFITYLLRERDNHRYLHGCIIPYGA